MLPHVSRQPVQFEEKAVLIGLLLFSFLLLFIVYALDPAITRSLIAETGLFELVSPPLWITLAALCLFKLGANNRWGWGTAALAAIFAAREADLHKAFTADSIFKHAFYRSTEISATQKFWGGLAAAASVVVLLWMLVACVRHICKTKAWRRAWGRLTLLSIALMVFTKICDRLENTIKVDYGILLSAHESALFHMHEEGIEMLLPILFAVALLVWAKDRARLGATAV